MTIREIREGKGLSLNDVEKAIGYSAGNLSRVERGQQTLSLKLAMDLSGLYGVTVDELIKECTREQDKKGFWVREG